MQQYTSSKNNKKKPKVSIGKAFKTIIWPRRNLVFIGLLLIVVRSLSGLILPWQSKILLDEVVPDKDFDKLYSLLIIVISYAFIGSTMANLTALDLTLMVLKFPLFILIHYFTVRKLLLDSKQKYLENIQLLKKLSATLHIDELTQVSNRKGFNRDFAIAIQTALRLKTPLSLVILDIDFFKQYNDSLGHPQGDQCLTEVAKVLSENCQRAVDNIARIGGEEFAYILTGSNIEQACAYIEKVQRELAEKGITHPQSKVSQHVTLSAGIALFDPLEDTQESLYQKADRALYKAKEAGRNQYACEQ